MNLQTQAIALSVLLSDMSGDDWLWCAESQVFISVGSNPEETLTFEQANSACAGTIIDLQKNSKSI